MVTALLVRRTAFSMRTILLIQIVVFIVPAFLDHSLNVYRLVPAALVAYWVVLLILRRRSRPADDLDIALVYGGLPGLVFVMALVGNWPDRLLPLIVERSPPAVETPLPSQNQVTEIEAPKQSDTDLVAGTASVESGSCAPGNLTEIRDPPPVNPDSVEVTDKSARRVLDRLIVQLDYGASIADIKEAFCRAGVEAIGIAEGRVYYVASRVSPAPHGKRKPVLCLALPRVSLLFRIRRFIQIYRQRTQSRTRCL